ncbi:MAG TPA: disulfide oxidoreductase [Candidatus Doudnabacteria bacterium]|nr:disulfide oxidoreductase [Candidatus Doudnabacteria bacterium]
MLNFLNKNALYLAFTGSLLAMLGSLYFSELAGFPPCVLCWYQRVAMYPLVVIIGTAIYTKDRNLLIPAFILAIPGWLIAVYHNLLYYNILPEAAAPCVAGISCTTKYIEWLGFLTIPLLALLGFTAIIGLLIIHWKATKLNQGESTNE